MTASTPRAPSDLPPAAGASITALIRAGTLDADLAAHLWLLLEARVPVLVTAGSELAGAPEVLAALVDFLPPGAHRAEVRGTWDDLTVLEHAEPSRTVIVAGELASHGPSATWGRSALRLVRAAGMGFGLVAKLHADSLEDVLGLLRRPPVGATDDELSVLGVVLVVGTLPGRSGTQPRRRVMAAHYLRPIARDAGGHVQRPRPAVLAIHDAERDAFEDFSWGIVPELAFRVGRRAGDYEREHQRRTAFLAGLAAAGVEATDDVRRALAGAAMAAPTRT